MADTAEKRLIPRAGSQPPLAFTPREHLLSFMPEERKRRRIIAFDVVKQESVTDTSVKLELEIVLQPYGFRGNQVLPSAKLPFYYYLGTRAARITITADSGKVVDHSPPVNLSVKRTMTDKTERGAKLLIGPEISLLDAKITGGSHDRSSTQGMTSEAEFTLDEPTVQPIRFPNGVVWHIYSTRGTNAIRDFLLLNLQLQITFEWPSAMKSGTIYAENTDVRVFDRDQRPIPGGKSILMLFRYWRRTRSADCEPIAVTMTERPDERV